MQATLVTTNNELQQILELQQKNLADNIDASEVQSQGFVTVQHTLEKLQQMHNIAPSVIIKDGEKVVAYAITMPKECSQIIPVLVPMFKVLENINWKGKSLDQQRYYVMGQICVDKAYRGQGLFDLLYHAHRDFYADKYDCIVTEIATRNLRSMRAHARVGFETIHTYLDETDQWAVVLWDWR
ncbi:MAG: GNAT family N-acetyltransferase [Chitinophagaceae bacterium]